MKKLLLCLLPTAILVAATPDPQTEKEVLSVMETYRQALIRKDASALAPLLSDDLTIRTPRILCLAHILSRWPLACVLLE